MKKRSVTPQRVAVIGFIISVFFISAAAPANNAPFSTNVNSSSQGAALRLGDTPEDPYYPSNKPFFQAPLSLTPHDHFWLSRPIRDEILTWRTADYRYGYFIKQENIVHGGLDIPAPEKTPVLAAADGTVVFSGYGLLYGEGARNDPYGIAVMVRHDMEFDGDTIYTVYTHLGKTLVKVNELVKAGQKIGAVGMTGNTSGPHLHFEVRVKGKNGMLLQNPELWIVPPLEHGVLAGRIINNMENLLANWNIRLTSLDTGTVWRIRTYDGSIVEESQQDHYYQENFVLNDLPAGKYEILTYYNASAYKYEVTIVPGAVTYINFLGKKGFSLGNPPGSQNTEFLN